MTTHARNITLLVVLAFAAFLLWSTLSSQRVECSVALCIPERKLSEINSLRLA